MPQQLEIELKFFVRDPAVLRQQLIATGAQTRGQHFEATFQLDTSERSLAAKDVLLRMRQFDHQAAGCLVTAKLPSGDSDPGFKTLREIEFVADDHEAVLALFEVLGYGPVWSYERRREILDWDGVEICLDELPIGWFVELEGAKTDILNRVERLGLSMQKRITISYGEMFRFVCRAAGLDAGDLTFSAFESITINPDIFDALTQKNWP